MAPQGRYARHSPYTDPGPYVHLLDALPGDIRQLAAVVRNVVVHYRSGVALTDERHGEIDNRWMEYLLATDQRRFPGALQAQRPQADRVAGCCRDFALLTVAALRQQGVPARSRIGFAAYFGPDFHDDHVIAEYWTGQRWAFADAQLDPDTGWGFDPCDIPYLVGAHPPSTPVFATAAQVWTGYRRGEIDAEQYGVGGKPDLCGAWFVRNYVLMELAHRQRDELLLWDTWGAMSRDLSAGLGADLDLVDQVAQLLLAADDGDTSAERELAQRYAGDRRLNPLGRVRCESPAGPVTDVDLLAGAPGASAPAR